MRKIFRIASLLIALSIIFASFSGVLFIKAVSYSGSGTMADPYIVTNAEQLQNIRENLSAHYKLGNTIDLNGVDFKPIGRLDAPFTGSFVCELNSDNTPKYIIKNLTVNVADTYNKDAFVSKKGKMEAALFGAATGATFSGIYVLDAKISNQIFGDNDGSPSDGNYNPGMWEMNSAILIGQAESCIVMNCGTTGEIKTRSNQCGGLIGLAKNTTIENCYSTADVITEGRWRVGGLIGYAEDIIVNSCFATGDVSLTLHRVGGLIGTLDIINSGSVTNCYTTGNASMVNGKRGRSTLIAIGSDKLPVTNCFTLGTCDVAEYDLPTMIVNNCYYLKGTIANCNDFVAADKETIKKAFSSIAEWDVSGDYPTLKNVGVVTDASKYQPGAVENTVSDTASSTDSGTTQGTAEEQTAVSVDEVIALIQKLPEAEDNLKVLDYKDDIKETWSAYEKLSLGEKESVDSELYTKLSKLRYDLSLKLADQIIVAIMDFPKDNEDFSDEDLKKVIEYYEDYQFLEDTVKEAIDAEYTGRLIDAYEYASAQNTDTLQTGADSRLTPTETVIVIVSGIVILMPIVLYTFIAVVYIRKSKRSVIDDYEPEDTEVAEE